ncbi:EGF-like domain protein [Necator americanus]|uniref:EGF-like domain protein n=1 Tax=Necator americanus TaxID=51031 RepID=W2U0V3_NECAM|nr:EGF-like domain protein [Necator americanus]ETN86937.1 EGF-like domain protein [Necator americanus]
MPPDKGGHLCKCSPSYELSDCSKVELKCTKGICLHGGTCIENYDGTYKCECLEYYHSSNCQDLSACDFANNCVNGTCQSVINGIVPGTVCSCIPGYTGEFCSEDIDDCASSPCLNGGTCHDGYMNYTCTCIYGVDGDNCDHDIPDCVPYEDDAGKVFPNRCVTKDAAAVCDEGFGEFTCVCSAQWTGTYCDLNVLIKDVLMAVYGDVNLDMIPMLEDLLRNPSQIKDMVPFIVGLQESDNRTELSWEYEDMFIWAAFEEKRLDLQRDLHLWNDVVLGNCFTFNHRTSTLDYKMRSSGIQGGLQVMMRVGSDEYVPWFDTASVLVFVHNKNEYVFSESVRYNAQPNGETLILIRDTKYARLAGRYGVCVKKPSEVKAYYYEGQYSTDGCLRSCYQDMIFKSCSCMDPRYPVAPNTPTCELVQRPCIDSAVENAGDPSTWESCVCPLPCVNQQYSVEWHRTKSVLAPLRCSQYSATSYETCKEESEDDVLITINLPRLEFQAFAEVPDMDLNRFISNLGGLLGVLMGVCILSFIEVAVLGFRLVMIFCSRK